MYKYLLYRTAIHTDQNARDATFVNSYRVTPLVAIGHIFSGM